MSIFCSIAKLLQLLNNFVVNIEVVKYITSKTEILRFWHIEIECSAVENTSVNYTSIVAFKRCRLLKKMQLIRFHMNFDRGLLTTIISL